MTGPTERSVEVKWGIMTAGVRGWGVGALGQSQAMRGPRRWQTGTSGPAHGLLRVRVSEWLGVRR